VLVVRVGSCLASQCLIRVSVATGIPTIETEKAPQREETVTAREASEESNALPGQENDVALEDLEQIGQPKPCRLRAISRHALVATHSHVPEWNRQQIRTMHRMHEGQGIDHNSEAGLTRKIEIAMSLMSSLPSSSLLLSRSRSNSVLLQYVQTDNCPNDT